MKRIALLFLILQCALCSAALAIDLPPVITTDWLEKNLATSEIRVIDIRKLEEYKEGHVASAVNAFYGSWAVKRDNLDNQLPETEDLQDVLLAAGIGGQTPVVIIGKVDTVADQVNNTRIAWTLRYAGVERVAILDGGMNKWLAEKKPVSIEPVKATAAMGELKPNPQFLATKRDVTNALGKATVVDTRTPDFFFGVAKLDFVQRAGHLPLAVNLPSAWIFTKEGTLRNNDELKAMATGVVGTDTAKEIIVYCDTGRLASGWWFVLTQMLGFQKVRMYDGSTQEWAADPDSPMVRFSWD
ncbi:MAG: rhodanese-like domain-containing protein [Desulfuromonadales bacterium]|nr:rhodanese-like domain-containing protein [Desulfuromonadales bacterium]